MKMGRLLLILAVVVAIFITLFIYLKNDDGETQNAGIIQKDGDLNTSQTIEEDDSEKDDSEKDDGEKDDGEEDDGEEGDGVVEFNESDGNNHHKFIITVVCKKLESQQISVGFNFGEKLLEMPPDGGIDLEDGPGTATAYVPHKENETHVSIFAVWWKNGGHTGKPDILVPAPGNPYPITGDGPTDIEIVIN